MKSQRSLFDVLGPVMIGPSSSHTAGAVRLGLLARAICGSPPTRARITLHGSFASTGRGHGTDLALVAGLLGMALDDPAIVNAFELARQRGLSVEFVNGDLGAVHPNSVRFDLATDNEKVIVEGASTGGGEVVITRIDGFDTETSGHFPLLLVAHTDRTGEVAAVTAIVAEDGANIANMHVSRARRGADALMLIETDTPVADAVVEAIASRSTVQHARRVPPV